MTHFSANVNRIALLRNSRDNGLPNLIACTSLILDAGADGITVHPRPDQRHIRDDDAAPLAALVSRYRNREFNIEGNPAHNLIPIVEATLPQQATFVPDAVDAHTSNRGYTAAEAMALAPIIAHVKRRGIRVSLFVEPDLHAIDGVRAAGADRIELYTEAYAVAHGEGGYGKVLASYAQAAEHARSIGLGVNAGHDLNLRNLMPFLADVAPDEVSIGHAFVADALELGLAQATKSYLRLCHGA